MRTDKHIETFKTVINIALAEFGYLGITEIKNDYGFPILICKDTAVLIEPEINHVKAKTLAPSGRYFDVDYEEVEDKALHIANSLGLKLLCCKLYLYGHVGHIRKEDDGAEFQRAVQVINSFGRWFYAKKVYELNHKEETL